MFHFRLGILCGVLNSNTHQYKNKHKHHARTLFPYQNNTRNTYTCSYTLEQKIQQALAQPNTLDQFTTTPEESQTLASTFAGLYALGEGDDSEIVTRALSNPGGYVLKPQREGGGNNLYDDELVSALQTMTYAERGGYILMQKIQPPGTKGKLVRGGRVVYDGNTVCELGVFGITLRDYKDEHRVLMDGVFGHILRSKSVDTDEGGVAAGYAFLSSPLLV